MDIVFDKTDKGREELSTRKYKLSPRMRWLLRLIDGRHSVDEILKTAGGAGLCEQHVIELLEGDFIERVGTASAARQPPADAAPVLPPPNTAITPQTDNEKRFHAVYEFYTQTIGSTLGLRGWLLQMKVEKAASIDDFRALRATYIEAMYTAKGSKVARELRDRLDRLLERRAIKRNDSRGGATTISRHDAENT